MKSLLDGAETRILEILFQHNVLSVTQIAQRAGLSRTAVYRPLESLEGKGLVVQSPQEYRSQYRAVSLDQFRTWKRKEIQEIQTSLEGLELLAQKKKETITSTDVRFYQGYSAVGNLYHDSWRNNIDKVILAITDYDQAYKVLGDFMENEYFPARIEKGVKVKSILPKSTAGKRDLGRQEELLREMKFLDVFKGLSIELNIYQDRMSIVQFTSDQPVGVLIQNQVIADAFRKIFFTLWNTEN